MYDTIPSYFNKKYHPFNGSIADVIAVFEDAKPFARLSCGEIKDEAYSRFRKSARKSGLFIETASDKTGFYQNGKLYHVYLSKSKKIADFYKLKDPENRMQRPVEAEERRFAADLGYPRCCVDNYFKKTQKGIVEAYLEVPAIKKAPFFFNAFLHSITNDFLSFHVPCSFECKKTERYNRRIYRAIETREPLFAKRLKAVLSMPIAVWFNGSFDDRVIILFNGFWESGIIKYSKCFILKTNYPRNERIEPKMEKSFSYFRLGNRVGLRKGRVAIYKDSVLLHSFPDSSRQGLSLFQFYA